jgi:hypothetical protein
MRTFARGWLLLMGLTGLAACGDAAEARDQRAGAASAATDEAGGLDRFVRWGRDIHLEENDRVLNVQVQMSLDPRGGFLVSDAAENQIRRYDRNGKLLTHFARKGEGPGEFSALARALPTRSGGVLAFNTFARGAVFDSSGRVEQTFSIPVELLYESRLLDDTLVLLAGPLPGESSERARLHVWNLANRKVVRSFFQPRVHGRAHEFAATTTGIVSMDVRHETVAATFAISDTVYFFDLNGRMLRKVPIPFRHFRPVSERRRLPRPDEGIVAAREWVGSFSFICQVFWLRDGTLLVQYQDRKGIEPHWRLLGMTPEGARLFDLLETPRLIQVDPDAGVLYFQKPGSLLPNVWTEATLRY